MPDAAEENAFIENFQAEVSRELDEMAREAFLETLQGGWSIQRLEQEQALAEEQKARDGLSPILVPHRRNRVLLFVFLPYIACILIALFFIEHYFLPVLFLVMSLLLAFILLFLMRTMYPRRTANKPQPLQRQAKKQHIVAQNPKRQLPREELEKEAEEVVKRKDIRHYLCPALQSASKDAFEIAKIIVPILVPLALAGTIAIPLNPPLIAMVAVIIARMGTASFCRDYDKKADEKKEKTT